MLQFEQQYLDALPCAQMYEKSYMHRDTITQAVVSASARAPHGVAVGKRARPGPQTARSPRRHTVEAAAAALARSRRGAAFRRPRCGRRRPPAAQTPPARAPARRPPADARPPPPLPPAPPPVTHVTRPAHQVTTTDFVITGSIDGHLKFWKKQEGGIEFVKHYRAHLGSCDGAQAVAAGGGRPRRAAGAGGLAPAAAGRRLLEASNRWCARLAL